MKRLFGKNAKPQVTPWNPTLEERDRENGEQDEAEYRNPPILAPQQENTFLSNNSYPSYSEQHLTKDNHNHHNNRLSVQHSQQSRNLNSQPLNHSSSLGNQRFSSDEDSDFPNPYSHSNSTRSEGNYNSRRKQAGGADDQLQHLSQSHPIASQSPTSIRPIPTNPSSVPFQDSFQSSQPMIKSSSANTSSNHPPSSTRDREYQPHTTSRATHTNRASQDGEESSGMVKRWKSLRGSKDREGSNNGSRRPNLQDGFPQNANHQAEYSVGHQNGHHELEDQSRTAPFDNDRRRTGGKSTSEEPSPYPVYSDSVTQVDPTLASVTSPTFKETHAKKEPKEAMRKFMAGFGKKDKEKAATGGVVEREIPIHQNPTSTNGNHYLDAPVEPSSMNPTSPNLGKKEGGWLKKEKEEKKDKGKEMEEQVVAKIAWLCGSPDTSNFWPYVLSLSDLISHSTEASKEAARSLRKEFKYSTNSSPRIRAARVWGILSLNASDRFKMQIAEKKFLNVVEETIKNKETQLEVKEMLLKTLAMLAWQFKDDKDFSSVTRCWNKIKPADLPFDGEPLDPRSPDFCPPSQPRQVQPQPQSQGLAAQSARNAPRQSFVDTSKIVSETEDMRKLHEECHIARHNAAVLSDSIANDGLAGSLVSEFSTKVVLSQEFLVSQIAWASSQADRSRERVEEEFEFQRGQAESEGRPLPESRPIPETREEALLVDILDACEKLAEANSLLEDARKRQREEEEERAVLEKSMVEVRVDRSALAQDPVTGDYYALESGQSSLAAPLDDNARASSSRPTSPAPPQAASTQSQYANNNPYSGGNQPSASPLMSSSNSSIRKSEDRNPYNRLLNPHGSGGNESSGEQTGHGRSSSGQLVGNPLSNPISSTPGRASPSLAHKGGPRPLPINTNTNVVSPIATRPYSNSTGGKEVNGSDLHQEIVASPVSSKPGTPKLKDDDGDSIILTPTQPSEKALGKRRAISDRGDAFDPRIRALALGDQVQQEPSIQEQRNPSPIPPANFPTSNPNVDPGFNPHINELRSRPPPQPPTIGNQNQNGQFTSPLQQNGFENPNLHHQNSGEMNRNNRNPFLV